MAQNKTTFTTKSAKNFILSATQGEKQTDALLLLELYREITGLEPVMYGPSIIGFGKYAYRYASGHGGEAPLAGFSPRKDSHVMYIGGFKGRSDLLTRLGKHKEGKVCVYVKRLSDIDLGIARELITRSFEQAKADYPTS